MISKSHSIPIWITIFSAFTFSLILLGSFIITLTYKRSIINSLETADILMERDSDQVFMKIENLYEPLLNITNQSTELPLLGDKPTLQKHPAESYLLNSMDAYPQIQILYIGFEDGDFYEILSCKGELKSTLQKTIDAPKGTEFAILRQFSIDGLDEPVRLWRFLNSARQTIGSKKESYTGYDPRKRPWYINAKGSNSSVKTDPYYFTNVKQMGLTISRTIDGTVPGVLGADILMYEMTSFLDSIKQGEEDLILIFNRDLTITAAQSEISSVDHNLNITDLDSPVLKGFKEYIDHSGLTDDMNLQLKVGSETYLIKVKKLPDKYSNSEFLFHAIPMESIVGPINRNVQLTALLSVLLIILSIPLLFYIARRISNPINQLVHEAGKIGQFKLDEDIVIKTRIRETRDLTEEMASMKRGLRLFSKYVPSQLVRSIMLSGSDVKIGGVSKEMTFLFTDIEGFTGITERTEPEELMQRLSVYLELISSVIRKHRGTVDKFIGDSVMAFWNAPIDDNEHIKNASLAAIEIQKELGELNSYWSSLGLPEFRTRIGVDSGVAVVGNLGCKDRMNYTAIGDSVNSSSRLEGLNRYYGTHIIIGESVAKQLSSDFIKRPLEKLVVKGKSHFQVIYELIGIKSELDYLDIEISEMFTKAFYEFYQRNWEKAMAIFQRINNSVGDVLTQEYILRCSEFISSEPDMDWNGVKIMEVK